MQQYNFPNDQVSLNGQFQPHNTHTYRCMIHVCVYTKKKERKENRDIRKSVFIDQTYTLILEHCLSFYYVKCYDSQSWNGPNCYCFVLLIAFPRRKYHHYSRCSQGLTKT